MADKTFLVPNISCGHCVKTIEQELGELPGVTAVKANKDTKMVTVTWAEPAATWQAIQDLLVEINYPPAA